jgi:hypothetical protein
MTRNKFTIECRQDGTPWNFTDETYQDFGKPVMTTVEERIRTQRFRETGKDCGIDCDGK